MRSIARTARRAGRGPRCRAASLLPAVLFVSWLAASSEAQPHPDLLRDTAVLTLPGMEKAGEAYHRAGELRFIPALTLYNAARSCALAGEQERALQDLERAFATGFVQDRRAVASDPDLASVRQDPRFKRMAEAP